MEYKELTRNQQQRLWGQEIIMNITQHIRELQESMSDNDDLYNLHHTEPDYKQAFWEWVEWKNTPEDVQKQLANIDYTLQEIRTDSTIDYEQLCYDLDIDTDAYRRDVFEYYIVSGWVTSYKSKVKR